MEQKKTEETRFKKTTLGELGPNLPIGVLDPATRKVEKGLEHLDWTTRMERELGKSKKKTMNQAEHVSLILSRLYTRVGHLKWDPNSLDEKKRRVEYGGRLSSMYSGDIFYMYYWLRRNVIGNIVTIDKVTCGRCEAEFTWEGDLDTVEVTTVDDEKQLDWAYELIRPFKIGEKLVEQMTLRSPRWGALEAHAGDIVDDGSAKIIAVSSSVTMVNGEPENLDMEDLDNMGKRDLEALARRLNEEFIGPKMSIEQDCPKCERPINMPIDWRHESFFGNSSR
jgi:hypothetical protein